MPLLCGSQYHNYKEIPFLKILHNPLSGTCKWLLPPHVLWNSFHPLLCTCLPCCPLGPATSKTGPLPCHLLLLWVLCSVFFSEIFSFWISVFYLKIPILGSIPLEPQTPFSSILYWRETIGFFLPPFSFCELWGPFFRISYIDRYCGYPSPVSRTFLLFLSFPIVNSVSDISASPWRYPLNIMDIWRADFICSLNQWHTDDSFLHPAT